jgi:hypothetical protein
VKGKTVVLAGAMIPYDFGASDALFWVAQFLPFKRCHREFLSQ